MPPKEYLVWMEGWNDRDSAKVRKGRDAEDVAERYAEEVYFQNDYPQVMHVHVVDGGGPDQVFNVEVEHVATFHARLAKIVVP